MVGRSIKRLQTAIQIKWKCVYNALINILGPHNKHIAKWCRLRQWRMLYKPDWLARHTPPTPVHAVVHPLQKLLFPLGCWLSAGTGGELSNGLARSVHAAVTGPCSCRLRSAHLQHSPSAFIQKRVKTKTTTILNGPRWGLSPRMGTAPHIWVPYTRLQQQPLVFSPPSLNRYRSNGLVDVAFYIF